MNVLNEMEQAGLIKVRIPEWKTVEVKIVDDYLAIKFRPVDAHYHLKEE